MKKILAVILAAITITAACFYSANIKPAPVAVVNKTVNMTVFTNNNYATKVYDASSAALTIKIKKAGSNSNATVWEKSFPALALKLFPDAVNAFKAAISLPSIPGSDDLQIFYVLTYNSNGSTLQLQGNEIVKAKQKSGSININV